MTRTTTAPSQGRPTRSGSVVLGISCDYHDAAAALVIDGNLVAAVEEERLSRRKHDRSLPKNAVRECLELAGIGADEVDHLVFYKKPLVVMARYLASKQRQGPRSVPSFLREARSLFGTNAMIGYRAAKMVRDLGASSPPVLEYVEHHMSHAASAFLPSPHESAAVVTIDGIGEWATTTIGHGTGNRIELLEELRYPDSVGLVYSFVTAWCGFTPNDDEYKVMGLAPYGTPRFVDALSEVASLLPDASVRVDAPMLGWFSSRRRPALERLLDGPPRRREDPVGQREADLAASVQVLTERAVLAIARRAYDLTGEKALCLAGGVALNCVANGKVLREGPFDQVWVQPAAGDAGGAIGAAMSLWHGVLDNRRVVPASGSDGMYGAALGGQLDDAHIAEQLGARDVAFEAVDDDDELASLVADELANGAIVGWFRGRMEFGPRALGHRSILADPRSDSVRERLNALVKGREEFRPFAPAVLAERASDWFDLAIESPYMLIVAPVRADRLLPVDVEPEGLAERAAIARSEIPACTHVDNSARVQTVDRVRQPDFHRLLTAFEARTNCPVLVNTSFNRAGDPIVATVDQALDTAIAGGIDVLVIGNAVVHLDRTRR